MGSGFRGDEQQTGSVGAAAVAPAHNHNHHPPGSSSTSTNSSSSSTSSTEAARAAASSNGGPSESPLATSPSSSSTTTATSAPQPLLPFEDVHAALAQDAILRPFLQDDFDTARYEAAVASGLVAGASLERLTQTIELLDRQVEHQVISHHSDLLAQAVGITKLEEILAMLRNRIESLQQHIERVRSRVSEPYQFLVQHTDQLEHLQKSCDLLRHVVRFIQLAKKLRIQFDGGMKEVAKAAQLLNDLDLVLAGEDLRGIDAVDSELAWIGSVRVAVDKEGFLQLSAGLETQNQADIATALQVFHNLGQLAERVETCVSGLHKNVATALKSTVHVDSFASDPSLSSGGSSASLPTSHSSSTLGGLASAVLPGSLKSNTPTAGASPAWRAILWTRLDKLCSTIVSTISQVALLQKVLTKRRDPVTHALLIDVIRPSDGPTLITSFWINVTQLLVAEFQLAAKNSTFVKNTLESEFPKLVRVVSELWESVSPRLTNLTMPLPGKNKDGQPNNAQDLLWTCLLPFENAYLSRSLSRMFDPVNSAFPSGSVTPPGPDDISSILRTITSELQAANADGFLVTLVGRNVSKAIKLLAVKSETLFATDPEASQISGPCTSSQSRNITLVNLLDQFQRGVRAMPLLANVAANPASSSASLAAVQIIQDALKDVGKLLDNIVAPLFDAMCIHLEARLLKMHATDYSKAAPPSDRDAPAAECSPFVHEFAALVSHISSEILARFKCEEVTSVLVQRVCCRAMTLFVRHAALVRPLGDGGKLRLTADLAQFEVALGPLQVRCGMRLADMGQPYRAMRAFRPILFMDASHIANASAVGDALSVSTALHHLFSRGPDEMQSPHVRAQMTPLKYSQWLDTHTEADALVLIGATLEAYAQRVRARGDKQFAPVYPLMLDLLAHQT
ncbi:hypothetical protein CAOG_00652 [Capsaspora owczarzaki ATCC 30864]|nr:hypothetical protein CAOG_00652 [Capsaspora owczarzaki ATCC 30864]|eukprot:XP_004365523.2 hypothetical protein CAOG_00652 [Capsaspora owczarzaki ATCC 30864]